MASNFNDPINILNTSNSIGLGTGGSLNVRGGASFGKDLYVGGNVNISGTTTAFCDNIIVINQNPLNSSDTGFLFERYSSDISENKKYSGIIYSETADEYIFGYLENDVHRGSVTPNGYIGILSQNLTLYSTSNSLGLGSGGGLTVFGGSAFSKDVYIGGNIHLSGDIYKNNNLYFSGGGSSQWTTSLTNSSIYYTSGNVGIGTTNPTVTLHVSGGGLFTSISSTNFNTTTSTIGSLFNTNLISTNITSATLNLSTGLTSASAQITNNNVTTTTIGTLLNTSNLIGIGNSNTIGNIFTTGGNVGIGTTNPIVTLHVSGNGLFTSISSTNFNTTTSTIGSLFNTNLISTNITSATLNLSTGLTSASAQIINNSVTTTTIGTLLNTIQLIGIGNSNTIGNIFTTGGNVGIDNTNPNYKLHVTGDIFASGYILSSSDIRLKENIETLNNCLDKVINLRAVTYNYKMLDKSRKSIGFIAQELEEKFPEIVFTDPNTNLKSIAYSNCAAILLECIKEQQIQINSLQRDLNYLKLKIQ